MVSNVVKFCENHAKMLISRVAVRATFRSAESDFCFTMLIASQGSQVISVASAAANGCAHEFLYISEKGRRVDLFCIETETERWMCSLGTECHKKGGNF